MDLELKNFEEKINSITEQFMSLLDSDKSVESSVGNKFESTSSACNNCSNTDTTIYNNISGPTIFDNGTSSSTICTNASVNCTGGSVNSTGSSIFELKTDNINIGGIAYGKHECTHSDLPRHAVKFDSVEQMELNQKLEGLYDSKKSINTNIYDEKPTIAFSDSNISRINSVGINYAYENYTKEKTDSTLNNKEVYEMSNYYGEGTNPGCGSSTGCTTNPGSCTNAPYGANTGSATGYGATCANGTGYSTTCATTPTHSTEAGPTSENVFYSFATVPADKSLVEKRSWKETLFMDIPWDTKIDIWGGIKKFCSAQVKITF